MELKAEYRTKRVKYVFLDIVKYTVGRSVEAQSDIVELLNGIVVKAVNEAGLTKEDTLYLPTGDGMGIGILGEAVEFDIHLRLSLKILSELANLT